MKEVIVMTKPGIFPIVFLLFISIFVSTISPMASYAEDNSASSGGNLTSPFADMAGQAPTEKNNGAASGANGSAVGNLNNQIGGLFQQIGGFLQNLLKAVSSILSNILASLSQIFGALFPDGGNNGQNSNLAGDDNSGVSVSDNNGNTNSNSASNGSSNNSTSNGSASANNSTTSGNASSSNGGAAASSEPGNGNKYGRHAFSPTNVISDAEFTDSGYMSLADIKNFLAKIGSQLVKNIGGVNVAEAVKAAADKNKINPLVLLATLQKEKGLVQTKKAITQKQLDWACGVGAYDGGNWNSKYKGFANQISSAAGTYKKLFNGGVQTVRINNGTSSVTPKNAATTAVYRYTPHTDGAKLFHSVYEGYKSKFEAMKI